MTDPPTALPAELSRAQSPQTAPPAPPVRPEPTGSGGLPHQPHGERSPLDRSGSWSREQLTGRLAELSSWGSGAALTLAFQLVLEAQHQGEPVAWVTTPSSSFFPPDVARSGIDLDALPVIRVPDGRAAARAADKLVRSGAFGLVIVDLGAGPQLPMPMQSRLLGLVGKHDTALLFLTEKQGEAPSVGSLVSLRAQVTRKKSAENKFTCEVRIIKDKRRGPGWSHQEIRHGPAGLH